ncbi:MAG: 50S ribosomal protein L3 [Vampirovibrionales bacterium]|nr:50S ribosomal protein L3 [Vampirovibrionales bacterium]
MSLPGFIGKKRGMTQVFTSDGAAVAVTVVEMLPTVVTQVKTEQTDGYNAVQVGCCESTAKHLTRPQQGHLQKNSLPLMRQLREFRVDAQAVSAFTVGDAVDPFAEGSVLAEGQKIDVIGQSIGKGFQGGTKKWHFGRGPMAHGSKSHRIPGSIGAGTTPGRVLRGKRMARQMGNERVTVKALTVIRLLPEQNVVLVKGAIPGVEGGLVTLRQQTLVR